MKKNYKEYDDEMATEKQRKKSRRDFIKETPVAIEQTLNNKKEHINGQNNIKKQHDCR